MRLRRRHLDSPTAWAAAVTGVFRFIIAVSFFDEGGFTSLHTAFGFGFLVAALAIPIDVYVLANRWSRAVSFGLGVALATGRAIDVLSWWALHGAPSHETDPMRVAAQWLFIAVLELWIGTHLLPTYERSNHE